MRLHHLVPCPRAQRAGEQYRGSKKHVYVIGGTKADSVITATAMGMQSGGGSAGFQLHRVTSSAEVQASLGPRKQMALAPAPVGQGAENATLRP